MSKPERIGHRGAPRRFLENTLPSFLAAFAAGADAVELDVQVTADGVAVVHHDPTLGSAVLPPSNRGRQIKDMTGFDLRHLELGHRGAGQAPFQLPTLEAVMVALAPLGTVYVEIKGGGEAAVAEVLSGFAGSCAVHSFDHQAIERFRRIAPDIPRGILFDRPPTDLRRSLEHTGARDVWPEWPLVDRALVEAVHGAGGRVIPWTVNTPRHAAKLIGLGVDALCTDDIPLVFQDDDPAG